MAYSLGFIDLIRGFPDSQTAMLGLLITSETHQKQGHGKKAFQLIEEWVRSWPEIQRIRIGVVATNSVALPFWTRLGFVDTGLRRPYEENGVISESIALVKSL